ncbi:MAG: class I SAM-dependent methyltransferase [Planctomycetes bacterium]|nr:class I SAM-dependent methyltransferase [Planctomycetota bacterium]
MSTFDPIKYKQTTQQQWQEAAEAWHRWGPTLNSWLGPVTEVMLDIAKVGTAQRVLDVAAGAGEQTMTIARRVGPTGHVLATDISSKILEFAAAEAQRRGLSNVECRVMDGENLDVQRGTFDAVVSRVGLIYFPDQQKALAGMKRALKPGGRVAAIVYSTPDKNAFFSTPVGIIRRRANLGPPLPGQPGPFSLGAPGVLEAAFAKAGFRNIETRVVPAPLRMPTSTDCVRFEQESFGALHQMLSTLDEAARQDAWREIADELAKFQTPNGFEGPCEMVVAVGMN